MNRSSLRVFYGWWIVSAAFFIAFYVGGIIFYGFTAIFEPIANDLGWSYTQISFAASLRGLETGLFAPVTGILVDRWGPRRLVAGGAVIAALGLFLLSLTTSLTMYYGAFFLISIGMSSCTMTVLMTTVANWFRRRVGLANGITMSGFGFGGLMIPVMVSLIALYDWRATMTILSIGMLVTVLPLSLVFRHKPEQYGYLPDGQAESPLPLDQRAASQPATQIQMRAKQAIRSATFWRLSMAFASHLMIVTAVTTHIMPYLSSVGIARASSSIVATILPLISIGGRLGLGWLSDRTDKRRVSAIAFVMMSLGMLFFGYASATSIWLLVPFLILFGTGYGGISALRPTLVREYFGRANFGTIFGLVIGVNMIGAIISAPLAGWVFDTWGSYQAIWFIFAALPIVVIISTLTTRPVTVSPS